MHSCKKKPANAKRTRIFIWKINLTSVNPVIDDYQA